MGYLKLGRSMPLTLNGCGNLGGDVECVPILRTLAERHPDDVFVLVGRNSGEEPTTVGLPSNVENPWTAWRGELRELRASTDLAHSNLSLDEHLRLAPLFDDITLKTFVDLDALVVWVGQHGTTNTPIPGVRKEDLTKPHDWCALYVGYATRGINAWRAPDPWNREPVFLNSDPRNYLKMRDLQWPLRHPVLTQYDFQHAIKHERYGDPGPNGAWEEWSAACDVGLETPAHIDRVWRSSVRNVYARLEVNSLVPGAPFGNLARFDDVWENRASFGIFINETRRYVSKNKSRLGVLRDWVLPLDPAWIHGTWSAASLAELGVDITPVAPANYFRVFPTVRSTFTTPASGTGWATAKPWEAFACGVACFFHPDYDDQDHVLADADRDLRRWLRVTSPEELASRVRHMNESRHAWEWVVRAQRAHFERAVAESRHIKLIEDRIWKVTP